MARNIILLVILALGNFLYVIDRNVMSLFMPVIRQDLNLSPTEQGLILGLAFILVLSFVAIPIARVTDRIGSRHVIAASLFTWSMATFVTGFANSFGQVFGTRMIVGAGESGFTPAVHAALAMMFSPKNLGRALAIFILGTSAGQVLGFYASGEMAAAIGWRGGFKILGAAGVILAVIVWVAWPILFRPQAAPPPPKDRPGMFKAFGQLFQIPGFGVLVLAAMAHSVAAYAVQQSMPTFLHDYHGMDVKEAGRWMGAVYSLAAVTGTLSMGFVIDYFKPENKLVTCLWFAGVSVFFTVPLFMAGLLMPETFGLWIFVPASFASSIYYAPLYFVLQNLASSENRASANAVVITSFQIAGLGLGPTLVGIGTDQLTSLGVSSPLPIAVSIVATLNIASGIFFLRTRKLIVKKGV